MSTLRVTVRGDGPSDDMLMPVVGWTLRQHLSDATTIDAQFANRFGPHAVRRKGLAGSIDVSLRLAPCDVLVIHRDAENETPGKRQTEIAEAIAELTADGWALPFHVRVIPVRMSEAWLLFDEAAIRAASGNPNGKVKLKLPQPKAVEGLPDPKAVLRELVRTASEATGRRLQKLDTSNVPRTIAANIDDFSPLRKLSAFRAFEDEVKAFAESWQAEE
ncbi:hypothetical protein J0H58_28600 [bacterium]|nr:hypothetical protein [bacterium]